MAHCVAARVGATETATRTSGPPQRVAESFQLQLGRLEEEGELACLKVHIYNPVSFRKDRET